MRQHVIVVLVFGLLVGAAMLTAATNRDSTPARKSSLSKQQQAALGQAPSPMPQPPSARGARVIMHRRPGNANDFPAALAQMLDENKDGRITRQELDDFASRMMLADTDNKGYITVDSAMAATNWNTAGAVAML